MCFSKEDDNTERSDRNEAMAAALVTFFKHVGGIKSTLQGTQIDRVPSFVAKDKRSIKFPVMTNKKVNHCYSLLFVKLDLISRILESFREKFSMLPYVA